MQDRIAFGLRVRSKLKIPGSRPANTDGLPDLTVTHRLALPQHHLPFPSGPYSFSAGTLLFRPPGIAEYSISQHGAAIRVHSLPRAPAEEVSALLIATAFPAALWMRGELVLHAAAAVLPGKREALAFAGPSGSGKSRLLAALLQVGGFVVAEDSVCVRSSLAEVLFSGLPGCLFTREAGAPLEQERHLVTVPREQQLASARAAGLVVLDRYAGPLPERLHGTQALVAVLDSFHRPRVPGLLGLMPALLPRLAQLVFNMPVYRWRPAFDTRGVATLHALADELQAAGSTGALPLV